MSFTLVVADDAVVVVVAVVVIVTDAELLKLYTCYLQ